MNSSNFGMSRVRGSAYTRRLRRYEGEAIAYAVEPTGEGSSMDLYSPFGPSIARLRCPERLIDAVNRHVDAVVNADPEPSSVGELALPEDFVVGGGDGSLANLVADWVARYLARTDRKVSKVRFEMFWVVRQFAECFSPVHFHSGDISGVLYLRIPDQIANEAAEEDKTYISARRAGYITFLSGGKQPFSKSLISFKPVVGDFYIFPGWLLHAVEPFTGAGERRSLAFNAFVD